MSCSEAMTTGSRRGQPVSPCWNVWQTFSYELIGKLDHYFRQNEVAVLDKDYGEQVTYLWMCKEPLDADMAEITNGRFLPEFIEERIVDVEV